MSTRVMEATAVTERGKKKGAQEEEGAQPSTAEVQIGSHLE